MQPVLIHGEWRSSSGSESFQAFNPATRQPLPEVFPVSDWSEIDAAVQAAHQAFLQTRNWPGERFGAFLDDYATRIEARAEEIVASAHRETALPVSPRLREAELPRTINQLRQAAAAAREGSWACPTIDTAANLRTQLGPIGPVAVFGPNNFPCAFNSIAGGDFAAAVAAGNPVIAKGHPGHPETSRLFAEAAYQAAQATGMPAGFIQLIYATRREDGLKLVSHPRLAAVGFTGGRQAGLALKAAAEQAGKLFYAELSSINPVYFLPGVLTERFDAVVNEFVTSCLMGTGQFCTNPGLVVLLKGEQSEAWIRAVGEKFDSAPVGTLLSEGTEAALRTAVESLKKAGAEVVASSPCPDTSRRYCHPNTLLRVTAKQFLNDPQSLQGEAFGNCSLIVVAETKEEMAAIADHLEGNLTGCIYSATNGDDDELYALIEPGLRQKVGRLLNDKMPTGVAVSPAMNHGGPFPASSHPGFTSVGIPASIRRFAMLQCYDNVRESRLPPSLRNKNPTGALWRQIDGQWTQGDVVTS